MLIDLVQARKGLHEKCVELFHDEKIAKSIYMYLCDGIEECDAVEPERKKGEWITPNRGLSEADFIRCSLCGFLSHPMVVRWDMGLGLETIGKLELPYECPKCHAEMEGEQNGND